MGDEQKPFHNPFAVLAGLRGAKATPPATPPGATQPEPPPDHLPKLSAAQAAIPRAVVRLERSGRGGKEVTVVDHLDVADGELGEWLKQLKSSLGCGGTIDDGRLVLQGDQRKRLPGLLTARGVKKVTVG